MRIWTGFRWFKRGPIFWKKILRLTHEWLTAWQTRSVEEDRRGKTM
jgi:hypothetical protein